MTEHEVVQITDEALARLQLVVSTFIHRDFVIIGGREYGAAATLRLADLRALIAAWNRRSIPDDEGMVERVALALFQCEWGKSKTITTEYERKFWSKRARAAIEAGCE